MKEYGKGAKNQSSLVPMFVTTALLEIPGTPRPINQRRRAEVAVVIIRHDFCSSKNEPRKEGNVPDSFMNFIFST